jgi:hypothetical protein
MSKPRLFENSFEEAKTEVEKGIQGKYPINPLEVYCSDVIEICEAYDKLRAQADLLAEALEKIRTSNALLEAPFYNYSEAVVIAKDVLESWKRFKEERGE